MRAVELYKEGKVSLGMGAKIAGLTLSEFFDLLKEYKVQINIDIEDAKKALGYAEERRQTLLAHVRRERARRTEL